MAVKGTKLYNLEKEWYDKIDGYRKNPDSLLNKCIEYSKKYDNILSKQPGAFRFNDIWCNIPPESISVNINSNNIDVPMIRTRHSLQISQGQGEISVSLNLVFTDNPLIGTTLEDEIYGKLLPLLTQLRAMPFVQVQNEYIKRKIIESNTTGNISRDSAPPDTKDPKVPSIEEELKDDTDIMLTYVTHNLSTVESSPRIIMLSLSFLVFNFMPYMKRVAYVSRYERNEDNVILRNPLTNKIYKGETTPVFDPAKSEAFYEFFAPEFQFLEDTYDFAGYVDDYVHDSNSEKLTLRYNEYFEVPLHVLSADLRKKLKEKKDISDSYIQDPERPKTYSVTRNSTLSSNTPKDLKPSAKNTIVTSRNTVYSARPVPKGNSYNEVLSLVKKYATGIDPMWAMALFAQESGYDQFALNANGDDSGIAQFTTGTGADRGIKIPKDVVETAKKKGAKAAGNIIREKFRTIGKEAYARLDNRFNLEVAVREGVAYLTELYNQFGDYRAAVAGYNTGSGNISKAIRKYGNDWDRLKQGLKPSVVNNHVKNICGFYASLTGQEQVVFGRSGYTKNTSGETETVNTKKTTTSSSSTNPFAPGGLVNIGSTDDMFVQTEATRNTTSVQEELDKIQEERIKKKFADYSNIKPLEGKEDGLIKYDNKGYDYGEMTSEEIKVYENQVKALLQKFGEDVDIIQMNNAQKTVILRWSLQTEINTNALQIVAIENQGGHDVPRIQLSGFQYRTHQFLGGHVEKLNMHVVTHGEEGELELQRLLAIIAKVSRNNYAYRHFAAFDGLGIVNPFVNLIAGGIYYSIDDVNIQTHPDIPGGSMVTLSFTDVTRAREFVKKNMNFAQEGGTDQGVSEEYLSEMLHEVLGKLNIKAGLRDGFNQSYANLSIEGGTTHWGSVSKQGSITAEDLIEKVKLQGEAVRYSAFAEKLYNDSIAVHINFWSKSSIAEQFPTVKKAVDDLLNGLCRLKWNNKMHPGKFSKYIGIEQEKGVKSKGTLSNDLLFDIEGGIELTALFNDWIAKYSGYIYDAKDSRGNLLVPYIKKKYPIEVKISLDQITSPAYPDFNLPPTINPDHYFYQPEKFDVPKLKQKELRDKAHLDVKRRYQQYIKQVAGHGPDKDGKGKYGDDHILYQLKPDSVANYSFNDDAQGSSYYNEINQNRNIATNTIAPTIEEETVVDAEGNSKKVRRIIKREGATSDGEAIENLRKENLIPIEQGIIYYDSPDILPSLMNNIMDDVENRNYYGMHRCFPAYKVYLIEEDDVEKLAPLRKDLNEMYGLNAIQEIRLVEMDDQPVDVLMIRFVDLSGRFTSAKFKDQPFTEHKTNKDIDTESENPLKGIMIKEGTRIQLRVGYSNNVNELDIKFNGEVVSIEGEAEYVMICQSYGKELVQSKKCPEGDDPTWMNAEAKELIHWALSEPEVKHFGRWKLYSTDNLQFSDSEHGVLFSSYHRIRPDGETTVTWGWTKNPAEANILTPPEGWAGDEGIMDGFQTWTEAIMTDSYGSLWELAKFASIILTIPELLKFFRSFFTSFYVYNQTLWSVIDELTYRFPGYVTKVLPYGDRNTLFFGPPNSPYYYRPFSMVEKEAAIRSSDTRAEFIKIREEYTRAYEQTKVHYQENGLIQDKYEQDPEKLKLFEQSDIAQRMKTFLKDTAPLEDLRKRTARVFRQHYLVANDKNLIRNKIKADYRDVYTVLNVRYADTGRDEDDIRENKWGNNWQKMYMNDFIQEEDQREATVEFTNATALSMAYRYGAQEFWRQSKKLYKGSLELVGEPGIKPLDYLVLFDDATQTYGPLEVKQHVLSIAPGEGMISVIEPAMASSVNDWVNLAVNDAIDSWMSGKRGTDTLETSSGWGMLTNEQFQYVFLPAASVSMALAGIVRGVTGRALLGSIGGLLPAAYITPVGAVISILTAMSALETATKQIIAGKNRQPIILSPLTKGGVPYVYGMNTYKIGGLTQWYDNEIKQFKDGFDAVLKNSGNVLAGLFKE